MHTAEEGGVDAWATAGALKKLSVITQFMGKEKGFSADWYVFLFVAFGYV